MASKKINQLTALGGNADPADLIPIWDVSGAVTLYVTASQLVTGGLPANIAYKDAANVFTAATNTFNERVIISAASGGIALQLGSASGGTDNYAYINNPDNTRRGMTVRCPTDQATDIFRWQLGTTVLAAVWAGGAIKGAGFANAQSTKTTAYTLTSSDGIIWADATSGAFAITLPTAVGIAGREYIVKKVDSTANAVTLTPQAGQTIDGAATYPITTQYASLTVVSNGANWFIV